MTYVRQPNRGLHYERCGSFPEELAFTKAWQEFCNTYDNRSPGGLIRDCLNPPGMSPFTPAQISERDSKVVATMFQWLGTPRGQEFLGKAMGRKRPSQKKSAFAKRR